MRAFGVGVGQISSPTLIGGWSAGSIPTDDRRSEVFYAAMVASLSVLWLSMQVGTYLSMHSMLWYGMLWCGIV